jgi:hypothetical protein
MSVKLHGPTFSGTALTTVIAGTAQQTCTLETAVLVFNSIMTMNVKVTLIWTCSLVEHTVAQRRNAKNSIVVAHWVYVLMQKSTPSTIA